VDLEAQGIALLSGAIDCAYGSPTFRASISNNGSESSGPFVIRWLVDGAEIFDGGHQDISGGGTDTHDHIWRDLSPGPHELRFIADLDNRLAETSETNNEAVISFMTAPCIG
jgi:subtilase family serine protease